MLIPKSQYENCQKKINTFNERIQKLQENPKVKEYIELIKQLETEQDESNRWYKIMKFEEYSSCNHILVHTKEETVSSSKGDFLRTYCGCIKCGLDQSINNRIYDTSNLTDEKKIQYEFLKRQDFRITGIDTEVNCSIALARNLYQIIIKENKDITDETLVELFKIAYENMKDKVKPDDIKRMIKQK